MSVSGIEGFTPYVPPQLGIGGAGPIGTTGTTTARGAADAASGVEFGELVLDNIDRLESLQDRTDQLAVQAATGDLTNIHDYTIAATETQVATQLTVAVRNKALEAFHEIMRMHVG
ncbi:flagellar hook-basal body complex protein FliE [Nocardioides massiliensis]|uniref:Flagellar hook-basal body complex protein FliE n=1 Tax=Nocardioides massiliensis TaxID=1325935 RepID=A0ABT9NNE1_9ACTN|nr:flagellar hook-basal body complex protein FliE [Nocardioides massiliensis]MDP9821714.1 flagellar hook-basal body complex protein FliE [Nocardioides massiliensis]